VVAAVLTAIRAQVGQPVATYAEFPQLVTMLFLLFGAMVAPELVSRDLRSGVLPLYFSRPLRTSDYALAKLAALVTAMFLPVAGALLVMFAGGAFSVDQIGDVWDEFLDFLPALAYTGLYAVTFGSISLLVASLAGRRAVAAAAVVATFLVTTPVVGVLYAVGGDTARQLADLASPMTLVGGVGDWLFESGGEQGVGSYGPLYGAVTVGLVAACVLLLLARYRKVK
jgi:ABC-2 type transport system permease protein